MELHLSFDIQTVALVGERLCLGGQIHQHLGGRRVNVKNVQLSAAIEWEAAGIMSAHAWSGHTINQQLAATLPLLVLIVLTELIV